MGSEWTVLGASEVVKYVMSEQGEILTKPYLDLCKLIFPIIDNLGPTLSAVKCDIGSNLSRLEALYSSDPLKYSLLQSIVQAEIQAKTAKKPSSCSNGLLWLTRAMDFFIELLRNLTEHPEWSTTHASTISYNKTLKRWHGWLTSSSFMVALKVVPERKKIIQNFGSPNANTEIEKFCAQIVPLVESIHKLLANFGLDNLKSI
ncbi:hypothetical protein LUZ63_011008 [Rhynchospora breviuscula]|uniref:Glycolipid transfer protein domain-containing protein n=1 Tax=Rhynchospora breviuscula TaxID=2022672 RepID=A0A9Q0CIB9_9POAL|nr:hypothetical protein LUZ63_011008 [Rhynchospora breviuscula]